MTEPNYDGIRRRVEERFNKQKELSIHAAAYIIVNGLLWLLWATGWLSSLPVLGGIAQEFGILLPLVVTIGWGIGMIAHILDYYYSVGGGARRRDQAIEREIERERALRQGDAYWNKPKRDAHLHLTEDGELEAEDDEYETSQQRRQR